MSSPEREPIRGLCCSIMQLALYNNYYTHNAEPGNLSTGTQNISLMVIGIWDPLPEVTVTFALHFWLIVLQCKGHSCGSLICHFMHCIIIIIHIMQSRGTLAQNISLVVMAFGTHPQRWLWPLHCISGTAKGTPVEVPSGILCPLA